MKTPTLMLCEALEKREELYKVRYWRQMIPERCPPVLWFGNHRRDPKIVTVGLNPSHGEFFRSQEDAKSLNYPSTSENRFYVYSPINLNDPKDPTITNRVIQSYDEYFRRNPYTRWFGKPDGYNIECFIYPLDASFYNRGSLGCVHIDLFPFVTVTKFSGLNPKRMLRDVFRDPWFIDNFKELVDFLDPRYMVVFGRSTTEYFNTHYDGSIGLNIEYTDGGRKYASYGISTYKVKGKSIPVLGLSVNLGNPRGFTKTRLANMARAASIRLKDQPELWKTLGFLSNPIPDSLLKEALSHEHNHKLAQIGDAVLSLTIREHYYYKLTREEIQTKNKELGENDYLGYIAIEELELQDHVISHSGLSGNETINEVYARTLEALIGALYKEYNLGIAREFIEEWIIQDN